jgi:hypothetical protein
MRRVASRQSHRANRIAVNRGNSFRIFKEGEQTVAAHVEKIMGNVGVGWRTLSVRMARARRARWRSQSVHDRHAEHTYIKIECHSHIIGDQREVMDSPQDRLICGTEISRDGDLEAAIAMSIAFLPRAPNELGTTSA